ncbi:carbohydrate kinase [Bacteroidales bacterium OttesenSCG-928-J19]|nr:carbohydrate kinase [Bacteroidales bacterium OttesenSCG-928-J19]
MNNRRVIGIGECVLDIIFKEDQPQKAVPGGSVFNCMVSLGRMGVTAYFVSELGEDYVGQRIRRFMLENRLCPDYIDFYSDGQSPLSLAVLDSNQNASYDFYRRFPRNRMQITLPEITPGDILIIGSYFAVNPEVRPAVKQLLEEAKAKGAIIYYDINFRRAHIGELDQLRPSILENFAYADIIRCSDEDLEVLSGSSSPEYFDRLLNEKAIIITRGSKNVSLHTPSFQQDYPINAIVPVSTIGAGDNFNAGLIYALTQTDITKAELSRLKEPRWSVLIGIANRFASAVCLSYDNYVGQDFIESWQQ